MHKIYYRFHLSESSNPELNQLEEFTSKLPDIININGLKLIRVATDFTNTPKNFSLLCELENETPITPSLLKSRLSNELISIDKVDTELLIEDCCSHQDHHEHSHHGHHEHSHQGHHEHSHHGHHEHSHHGHHEHSHQGHHEHSHQGHHEHSHQGHHEHSHQGHHEHSHQEHHEHSHQGHHEHSHQGHHEHSHQGHHEHSHQGHHEHSHQGHHEHSHEHTHGHGHSHASHWWQAGIGLISGALLLALSLSGLNLSLLAYSIITGLSSLTTLYLGRTVYKEAWHALWEKRWDMSTLYTLSTLTIVAVSIASIFVPSLPMMLEAAPFVLGFWHLGEAIEHTLIDKLNQKLDVRDGLTPLVLLKGKPDREISVKELIPNDIIEINSGEIVPVDGIVLENTLLYTTAIDGSPYLKEFYPGDKIKAGMRVADHLSSLQLRATTTYQNSYLSLIAQHISKANNEKAPIEILANKILKYFIPGLLVLASLSAILIGSFFGPALALQCVIAVLVSACPCALSVITPMAVKIGMKKAAEEGVHFNNGKALQAAADIDTIVFDLNGTLTTGKIAVKSLFTADPKYLKHIALLESKSKHPVGKTILEYIQNQSIVFLSDDLNISYVDQSHHAGIKAVINGVDFMIGNREMLIANGIFTLNEPYDNPENGSTYIVRGKRIIGQINLIDPLRPDAVATIKQLKKMGKTVHLCTGADKITAESYAKTLGIAKENICANTVGVISHEGEISKTSYIQKLRNKGHKVAMVGDAANDLAAIADSDLGIAVKSSIGDVITEQHAGMVLQKGYLFPLVTGFDASKKTKHNIFQNLSVSFTMNLGVTLLAAGLLVAVGFTLNPAIGVFLMIVESSIVLANLHRLKQQKLLTSNHNELKAKPVDTTTRLLRYLGLSPQPQVQADLSVSPDSSPSISLFTQPKMHWDRNEEMQKNQEETIAAKI